MDKTSENFIDEKSGISIEEQREILVQINGITEQNRSLLSHDENGKKQKINAKKSGAFFPLSVNAAAVIIFIAGAFLIISFNTGVDAQTRTGSAVYNLTERALIGEIRKDTQEKLTAKDREISDIAMHLSEVDAQLSQLQSHSMTSEQLSTQETLLALRDSYLRELSVLQDDRSSILEESRTKEAVLRAQLEQRSKEFDTVRQSFDSAASELERLSGEQEIIAAMDAHFSGGFAVVTALIQDSQYDQAVQTLENLRGFNNSNSLSSSRSFQTRKEFYNQSINSMEALVNDMQNFRRLNNAGILLGEKNAELEENIAQLHRTIDALNSGNEGQAEIFNELQESVNSLRAEVSSLSAGSADKDRTISALRASNTEQAGTIASLRASGAEQTAAVSTLRATNSEQAGTISTLRAANAEQTGTITRLENTNTQQAGTISTLRATNSEQAGTISTLRAANAEQTGTISTLRAANSEQAGTIARLENANSRQTQEITNLRNMIRQTALDALEGLGDD